MAFQFKRASCVAAGTFNIYIIQPQWLTSVEILPSDVLVTIETNLDRPGIRLSSSTLRTVWIVTPTRLVIETTHEGEDCGALMAAVLQYLRWTPVSAIGTNVVFESEDSLDDCGLTQIELIGPAPVGYEYHRRGFSASLEREGRLLNLVANDVQQSDRRFCQVSGNAHTQLRGQVSTEAAQVAARRFSQDVSELTAVITATFGVAIDHVSSNS